MYKKIELNISRYKAHKVWKKWKKDNPQKYEFIIKNGCSHCQTFKELHVHHIDGDRTNNCADNLQCLCRECHFQEHKHIRIVYLQNDITPLINQPKKEKKVVSPEEFIKDYQWIKGKWIKINQSNI